MTPASAPDDQVLELRANEERLRLAFQGARMGFCDFNLITGKIALPDVSERILGLEPDSFDGTVEAFSRLVHPEDRDSIFRSIHGSFRQNAQNEIEFRVIARNGGAKWIAARAETLLNEEGQPVRWVGVIFDITDRKRTELDREAALRDLRENEAKFRRLAETDAIGVCSGESELIIEANQKFLQMIGYTSDDLKDGKLKWPDLVPPEQHHLHFRAISEAKEPGVFSPYRKELIRKDGSRVPALAGGVYFPPGTKWVSFLLDLSGSKQAEEQLARLNRQLAERIAEFQKLAEVAPFGICVSEDAGCENIWMNPAGAKLAGLPAQVNISKSSPSGSALPYKILRNGHELRPEEMDLQVAAATGQELHDIESDIVREDGTVVNTLCYAAPLFREDGQTRGAIGVFIDITNRKRMEEAIRESESRFRSVFDQAALGIAQTDQSGLLVLVNQKFCDILGYSREELLQRHMQELTHPDDNVRCATLTRQMLAGEIPGFSMEKRYIRKDGATVWVRVAVQGVRSQDCESIYPLGIVEDVTERNRVQEQILVSQKLESLGVLAGGVAHDFNNLLTGIMGNASLAADMAPSGALRSMLEDVVAASEQAADLTRQMLAYAGKGRFILELINLSELVREVNMLIKAAISKDVPVRLDLAEPLPPIRGDASQIHQLVMNLVINAAESIKEGATGSVLLSTRLERLDRARIAAVNGGEIEPGAFAVLRVQDNGCGMDEATKSKIFDPFFTTKFAGRGLGLAAVSGIIRAHKGAIHVSTRPGQGTTFSVFLPVCEEPPLPAWKPPLEEDFHGSGTILVVDDEEVVRETAKKTLEHYGYKVLLAANGQEAVDMFSEIGHEISAVVLDLTMPVMGGDKVAALLKSAGSNTPVILSSGYEETQVLEYFPEQTVHFLQKPYSPSQLAEKIKTVLEP